MLWKFSKFVLPVGAYYKMASATILLECLIDCHVSLEYRRVWSIFSKTKLSGCDVGMQVRIAKTYRSCNC